MFAGLLRYEKDRVLHSGKMIVPLLVYIIYLYFENSVKPQSVLPTFGVGSVVAFLVMISFGYIYHDLSTPLIDGAMLVKFKNRKLFYMAKVCVTGVTALGLALITVAYEVLENVLNGMRLFDRMVYPKDLISALLVISVCAFCGGMIGLLCNDKIFAMRELRVMAAVLAGMLSAAKIVIATSVAGFHYIAWLLPMVLDLNVAYSHCDYVEWGTILPYIVGVVIYTVVLIILYVWLMDKKGLEK